MPRNSPSNDPKGAKNLTIQARQFRQKKSGKQNCYTLKTAIRLTLKGRIVHVSKPHPGSVHDFAVFKGEQPPPKESRLYVDSGYQGIADSHSNADLPYKKSKNNTIDAEDKAYNTALSRLRIRVEHTFAQLKIFKILSDRYRNKLKRYGVKFNIVTGIVNLKNGFA